MGRRQRGSWLSGEGCGAATSGGAEGGRMLALGALGDLGVRAWDAGPGRCAQFGGGKPQTLLHPARLRRSVPGWPNQPSGWLRRAGRGLGHSDARAWFACLRLGTREVLGGQRSHRHLEQAPRRPWARLGAFESAFGSAFAQVGPTPGGYCARNSAGLYMGRSARSARGRQARKKCLCAAVLGHGSRRGAHNERGQHPYNRSGTLPLARIR